MRRKLNDARGETLVEVLASILIGSLSVALLFSMVMASGNMDRSAEETDKVFNESLRAAEKQTDTPVSGQVTVRNNADPLPPAGSPDPYSKDVPVNFFGGQGALSYALPKETSP